jgi:hypothetical protein
MKKKAFGWLAGTGILVLLVSISPLAAQAQEDLRVTGIFNDYTAAGSSGPWEVRGQWSVKIKKAQSGKADFSAALTMERSDMGVTLTGGDPNNPGSRNAHTHHYLNGRRHCVPTAEWLPG